MESARSPHGWLLLDSFVMVTFNKFVSIHHAKTLRDSTQFPEQLEKGRPQKNEKTVDSQKTSSGHLGPDFIETKKRGVGAVVISG
jgi:hypothetical protein